LCTPLLGLSASAVAMEEGEDSAGCSGGDADEDAPSNGERVGGELDEEHSFVSSSLRLLPAE
jgi:hypothetical protein